MMTITGRAAFLGGIAAAALWASSATAQQANSSDTDASSASGSQLGDIIVTAEKHPSTAQTTPIALNVYDAQTLKNNNVGNVAELSNFSPSINIGQSAGASIITIRGVSSRDVTEIGDPAVAVSIDGIYLQRPTGMNASFYDLERIEVLRGPQGTLYGRNATGGAINIITQKPLLDQDAGYIALDAGNYRTINVDGAVNLPIGDKAAVRASFVSQYNDGYRFNGVSNGDDQNNKGGRLQLLWKPTNRLSMNIGGSYLHMGGTGSVYDGVPLVVGADGIATTRPPSNAYDATHFRLNTAGYLNVNDLLLHGQVDYDFGPATLTYIAGYHRQDYNMSWDNDGQPTKGFIYTRHELTRDFSQELRLASSNKHGLVWQVGGFYFHESFPLNNYFDKLSSSDVPVNVREYHYQVPTTSYAAFGQASYDITDKLRITGGVRYSHDDKRRNGYSYVGSLTQDVDSGTATRTYAIEASHVTTSKVTWHAGLEYQVAPHNLLYAKADTGYKAGGFNNFGFGTYAPETIQAYEIGSKNRFLNNALQVNLSAFYYDYKNQQVAQYVQSVGTTITVNAGVSHMYGGELETNFKPSANDQLDFSAAYLHAKYVDLAVAAGTSNVSLDGNDVIQSPKWTLTAGYQHDFPAFHGTLTPRVQTQYRSAYFLTIYNRPDDRQEAFTRTDVSLTYRPDNTGLSVSAYVHNLENAVVITDASESALYGAVLYQFDAPRTYGMRVQFDW